MPRSDEGGRREKYARTTDNTGKMGKENQLVRAFWDKHKVKDMMVLDAKEAEAVISKWMEDYEARQIARNRSWWYPSIATKTLNQVRNTRTNVDKGWHL
jgi:hypothetical protein